MASHSAGSAKTPNTPLSADVDLDVAWKATISKCQSITNWDLNANSHLSVDDVVSKIKPTKRDGKSESHDQAKKVFRRSLECISRFGEIAAQSASMVFGPSNQCFNAVNFVIIAAQGYTEAVENLGILMERISVFFDRLKNYLEDKSTDVKLDPRLRVTVYRVLDHFLVVMGNAHKITSSFKGKLKLGFKVTVFGEDGGIKDALAKLETLVSDVTRAEITSIVKNLSEAARGIRGVDKKLDSITETLEKTAASTSHLQAAEERRSDADKEQNETTALRKALGIDEKKEPWQDRQDELGRDCIPGTGQWLLDYRYPSYPRWSDPKETSLNVISLRGEQNFGKSFLSSIVIDDLLKKHRTNPRVCVAFYYFNADRDQGDTRDSGKESVNKALKAILWQLTQANRDASREFRKLAIKACESNPDLSKTDRLWNLLITEHEKSLNATFYIVLDGLEPETEPGHPLASILSRLTPSAHQQPLLKTRVLVTGRPASLATLTREMDQKPLEINLTPPEKQDQPALNHNDILLFAEDKLNDISFYRGALEADDRDLKERIKITLARGVRGDYFTLSSKLNEIAKARDIDKVEEILKRADEDRAQVVARQIKQLNESLSPDELEEVNHLLVWVIGGFRWPTLKLLEMAMRLKDSKNKLLGPLLERIGERYSDLFSVDDVEDSDIPIFVQLRSEEIENFLLQTDDQALALGRDVTRRSVEGGFQEAEIALMERIIKAHMLHVFGEDGKGIYERYAFTEFFDSKRGPTAAQTHYHEEHTHVIIARSCLISLCDKYDEAEFRPLHDYGFLYFADHLKEQVDKFGLEKVDVLAKYDIGRKLVRLLKEQTFVDHWLDRWIIDKNYWVFETDLVDAVHKWLTDPDVQKALQDMPQEKKWVGSLTAEGTPSTKVLANIAAGVARLWLNGDNPGWPSAFGFMFGYYNQLQGKRILPDQGASVQDVEDVTAWARSELPNEDEESKWHYCVGVVLHWCEHLDAALAKYRQVVDVKPDFWRARQHIALALGMKGEHQDAIFAMNELIEKENTRLDSDEQYALAYWDNMLPSIVNWNLKLKENTAAEDVSKKIVRRIMDKDSFDVPAQLDVKTLMEIQIKQRKHLELVQLLEDLSSRNDLAGNWLIEMMYTFHSEETFHDTLLDIAKNADYLSKITELYQAAIEGAVSTTSTISKDVKFSLPMRLRTMHARLMWHLGSEEQRRAALSDLEEMLRNVPDEDDINFLNMIWSQRLAIGIVGPALLTAALEQSPELRNREVTDEYLRRLEALQDVDHAAGRYPVWDVRRPLARMLFLMKQPDRARMVIRDYVAVAVQLLEASAGDNMEACDRLVNAFLALEDDVNATAAFTLFNRKPSAETLDNNHISAKPNDDTSKGQSEAPNTTETLDNSQMSAKSHDDTSNGQSEVSDTNGSKSFSPTVGPRIANGGNHSNTDVEQAHNVEEASRVLDIAKTDEPEAISSAPKMKVTNLHMNYASAASGKGQTEDTTSVKTNGIEGPGLGTDTEAGASPTLEEQESADDATPTPKPSLPSLTRLDTSVSTQQSSKRASPPSPISAWVSSCNGIACESTWEYPSDMYACRDCHNIICPLCYQALKDGTDTLVSCHQLHSHLHIPPVDAKHFIDRPKGIVWVGGAEVPLQQWLDSIKSDWGLEQRNVKARDLWLKAVRMIKLLALKPDRHDSASSNS